MKIDLPDGQFALIDEEDWWIVKQFHWYTHRSTGYVFAGVRDEHGKLEIIKLHRLLAGFPPFPMDHINGNKLDNRRGNLRPCTHSQNLWNRGKQKNNTSGFKGVSRQNQKWRTKIWVEGRQIHLGYFCDKQDAHEAYRIAAEKYHGEFACV